MAHFIKPISVGYAFAAVAALAPVSASAQAAQALVLAPVSSSQAGPQPLPHLSLNIDVHQVRAASSYHGIGPFRDGDANAPQPAQYAVPFTPDVVTPNDMLMSLKGRAQHTAATVVGVITPAPVKDAMRDVGDAAQAHGVAFDGNELGWSPLSEGKGLRPVFNLRADSRFFTLSLRR